MVLLLVFFCCLAVVEVGGGLFSRNSLFAGFNSRLGGHKSPISSATGIANKRLIRLTILVGKRRFRGQNRRNSQLNGKNWEFGISASDAPGAAASVRRSCTGENGCRADARESPPRHRGRRWASQATRKDRCPRRPRRSRGSGSSKFRPSRN